MSIRDIFEKFKETDFEGDGFAEEIEEIVEGPTIEDKLQSIYEKQKQMEEDISSLKACDGDRRFPEDRPIKSPAESSDEEGRGPVFEARKKERSVDGNKVDTGSSPRSRSQRSNDRLEELKNRLNTTGDRLDVGNDIPSGMKRWIRRNLNRGFTPEQLKRSLDKNGQDPGMVDRYMNNTGR